MLRVNLHIDAKLLKDYELPRRNKTPRVYFENPI